VFRPSQVEFSAAGSDNMSAPEGAQTLHDAAPEKTVAARHEHALAIPKSQIPNPKTQNPNPNREAREESKDREESISYDLARDFTAARVSRSTSRRRRVSRLSCACLPFASPSCTLTRPFLK
jgi:hypothetical protein